MTKERDIHPPKKRIELKMKTFKNLENLDFLIGLIKKENKNLICSKFTDVALQQKEEHCYEYILSKHRTLFLRQMIRHFKNAQPQDYKSSIINFKTELAKEMNNRINLLIEGLSTHPDRINLVKKLNNAREKADTSFYETPVIMMEVEGKLAFRLEYDSNSLFTKTAYDNLGALYNKVFFSCDLKQADLISGAKSVAAYMIDQSLSAEQPLGKSTPITDYQEKLREAKRQQYRILKRTFSDMTKRTAASYRKDLTDELINVFIPDNEVISKFKSTNFRTYGKNAIDHDLHRVFVLMMECDIEDDLALKLMRKLQEKYFSEKVKSLSPEDAEANIKSCLSELVASLADILHDQMVAGQGFKKPLLTKHLNNLFKKYNHPYRIGKKKISKEGEPSVFRLTMVKQTRLTAQEHFEKKVLKPRIGLSAIIIDILLGLGAGGLTTAAFLALPFAIPVVATGLIAGFIAVCSTYVNYRLYHRFFKPFAIRIVTKGLFDALFGEKAPLNRLRIRFNQMSLAGKIVSLLATLIVVIPLIIGFSAIVSIATMMGVMTTMLPLIAGFPVLIIGTAFAAVSIAVLAFIVHLPLILIVTVDLAFCLKGLAETVVNIIRGEKGDSLGDKLLRGLIVVPLATVVGLLVLPLVAATILTVKDFTQATVSFGNLLRRVCNSPKGTLMAMIGAVTSFPGVLIMGLGGLFQASAKGLGMLKSKLFGKQEIANNAVSSADDVTQEKAVSENPWFSSFHRRLGHLKTFFKALTLTGNGAGNGLIAGDAAPNKRLGIGVTLVAGFSSICSCVLGFFGWNKAKVGDKGTMVQVDSTYKELCEMLAPTDDGEGGQANVDKEAEIESARALPVDKTASCRAFFEKRQKPVATCEVGFENTVEHLSIS